MNYRIEIINTRNRKNEGTSLNLITGFGMLGLGAFAYMMGSTDWTKTLFHNSIISSAILSFVGVVYGLMVLYFSFFKNAWLRHQPGFRLIHFTTILIFGLIFLASQWWLAAGISAAISLANIYAFFAEKKQALPLFIGIDDTQITLPLGSKRRMLQWIEVERVIVRHGNITIDTVDNFLFQYQLKNTETQALDIEAFCAAQVLANIKNRPNEDW